MSNSPEEWAIIHNKLKKWRGDLLKNPENKDTAITTIAEEYGKGRGDPKEAWAVLVSTIISLRTKDDVTRQVSVKLLEKAPDPKSLLSLGSKKIIELLYPAGFYRNKTESLIKISKILLDDWEGKVPADMDALLSLPGVGRKTANLVLTEAFNMYGICVDIHVHRICNRAGWLNTSTPDKTEMTLREILPKKYWKTINSLLVLYGQNICRPLSPFCSRCVIHENCQRVDVGKSR